MQNVQFGMSCVARSTVLLKTTCRWRPYLQIQAKKVGNHRPIVLAVDGDGLAILVLKEILTDDATSPKSIPNTDLVVPRASNASLLDAFGSHVDYFHPKFANFV